MNIDIKYLPQMPDEKQRRYLFVTIDLAARWEYCEIYSYQSENSSVNFLRKMQKNCPVKTRTLLTDNGRQFTYKLTCQQKTHTGKDVFDKLCQSMGVERRLIQPRHPQTNVIVECLNGRIGEILNQARFISAKDLETTLNNYLKIYDHNIPKCALNHKKSKQVLKDWQQKVFDLLCVYIAMRILTLPFLRWVNLIEYFNILIF